MGSNLFGALLCALAQGNQTMTIKEAWSADHQPSITSITTDLGGMLYNMRKEMHDAVESGDLRLLSMLSAAYGDLQRAYHRVNHARRRIMHCEIGA
jgi:hypothetical protein